MFSVGAGNAVFPLLSANKNSQLDLRAYDYSAQAVKLVQVCCLDETLIRTNINWFLDEPPLSISPNRNNSSRGMGSVIARVATRSHPTER